MAVLDANGNLQPEPGDILPRKVAYREDDPPAVRQLIEDINPTIETAEDLELAIQQVDDLRRELASKTNVDNPHIADPDDPIMVNDIAANDAPDSPATPAPSTLGRNNKKSPAQM